MAGRPQRRARLAASGELVEVKRDRHGPDCDCQRCRGFGKGNDAALRHGGYSLVGISERAAEIANQVRPTLPAYSVADEPALLLLATTLARIERANAAVETVDENASPLGSYLGAGGDEPTLAPNLQRLREDLRAWIGLARRLTNDLGMTPTSRAKLGLDIAATQRTLSVIDYYRAREAAGLPLYEDEDDDTPSEAA
jgi:hypothetical protein